jgi:hypothetical protein
MSIVPILVWLLLLLVFCLPIAAEEGDEKKVQIEEFEETVEDDNEDNRRDREEDGSSLLWEVIMNPRLLFGLLVVFPGEDSLMYHGRFWNCYFSDYPYMHMDVGRFSARSGKRFAMSYWGYYFYGGSGLRGFGLRSRIAAWPYLGVELHLTDLTERLGNWEGSRKRPDRSYSLSKPFSRSAVGASRKTGVQEDHLQLYAIFLDYYRVRADQWALWWGVGMKGMEGNRSYHGPAFNLGTEIYPFRPLSLSLECNVGVLNDRTVSDLLLQLNGHVHRTMFYVGYQRFSAGSTVLDGAIGGFGLHI